jgi:hypothetical protein
MRFLSSRAKPPTLKRTETPEAAPGNHGAAKAKKPASRLRNSENEPFLSFAVNPFSKPPFLHLNRSANALLLRPESVHQKTQVFSLLIAFLSLVNAWADRFGRRGDQRVSGRHFCSQGRSD